MGLHQCTWALGGMSGFFGITDTMFESFPFLISDMKASKRNCRQKKELYTRGQIVDDKAHF